MAAYDFVKLRPLIGLDLKPIEVLNRGEATFKADLQEIYDGIQDHRTAMLADVRELQLALRLLLDAEAARIAALAPEDPRVAALRASSQMTADRIDMLDHELDVSKIRVPTFDKTEALVHGQLVDDGGQPVANVNVLLADERGTPIPDVPPSETDTSGYYAIVVPAGTVSALGTDRRVTLLLRREQAQVQAPVDPFALAAGSAHEQPVQLTAALLQRLGLRFTFPVGRIVTAVTPLKRMAGKRAAKRKAAKGAKGSRRRP